MMGAKIVAVLPRQFVNDFDVTVDGAHQDTLDELLVNANS